jgi:ApaG protein
MSENTLAIQILTDAQYLVDQSAPENSRYLWSYDIRIMNQSDEIIQLLTREWRIVDSRGKTEEVRGHGVIGLQPIIKPGKEFSYSSFCQLTTPEGSMEGAYEMQTLAETKFSVAIPKFLLNGPLSGSKIMRSSLH